MLMSRVAGPQVKSSLPRQSPLPNSAVAPDISSPFHPTPSRAFMQQLERETSRSRTKNKGSKGRRCISSAAVDDLRMRDELSNSTESDLESLHFYTLARGPPFHELPSHASRHAAFGLLKSTAILLVLLHLSIDDMRFQSFHNCIWLQCKLLIETPKKAWWTCLLVTLLQSFTLQRWTNGCVQIT